MSSLKQADNGKIVPGELLELAESLYFDTIQEVAPYIDFENPYEEARKAEAEAAKARQSGESRERDELIKSAKQYLLQQTEVKPDA